jgi:L-serine dehydratase
MSLLDVIGPVMVGPSSSHTAGACRLALLARHALIFPPHRERLELHGSFAKTAKGHGTDLALAVGLLGFYPNDSRIPEAIKLAQEAGLNLEFVSKELGDVHPNTVRITLENAQERLSLTGSSGGCQAEIGSSAAMAAAAGAARDRRGRHRRYPDRAADCACA